MVYVGCGWLELPRGFLLFWRLKGSLLEAALHSAIDWLLSPPEREQQDDECHVSSFNSTTSSADYLAKEVSPGMFWCVWEQQRLALEAFDRRWESLWDAWDIYSGAECISGWHCCKTFQEKKPGVVWTVAAYLLDLLCLSLSSGNGEPAAARVFLGVKWANRCWVPLRLGNSKALWKLSLSLTLDVYPIKIVLTSKLTTHITLCLNFCGK